METARGLEQAMSQNNSEKPGGLLSRYSDDRIMGTSSPTEIHAPHSAPRRSFFGSWMG
jgi:hypothetical protein